MNLSQDDDMWRRNEKREFKNVNVSDWTENLILTNPLSQCKT